MKALTRKSNFELLRIVAMCMIILIHLSSAIDLTSFGLKGNIGTILGGTIVGICNIGPSCFCLISGYFGIKFSRQKLIKMELLMISFSLLETALLYWFFPQEMTGAALLEQLIKSIIPFASRKYWFYSCYLCLFIFSRFIKNFIEKLKEQELQIFIIVSLVIFSIFPTIFYFEIVQDSGKGIVQMVLLYIIGRYIRLYKNFPIARWKCLLALLFLWVINTISIMYPIHLGGITHSLCRDNSITNLAMTIILFYLFKDINITSKIINYLTINIFAVFALENSFTHICSGIIQQYGWGVQQPVIALFLLISICIIIFIANVGIGAIRELFLSRLDQLIIQKIIYIYNGFLRRFIKHL